MDVLGNTIEQADTILLVLKGNETRLTGSLQTMLKRMTIMFGENWWNYLVVGVTFWPHDQHSVDSRVCNPNCKDEDWFRNAMYRQFQEKLGVTRNFTFVFMDSFSQAPGPPGYNTEDTTQQMTLAGGDIHPVEHHSQ